MILLVCMVLGIVSTYMQAHNHPFNCFDLVLVHSKCHREDDRIVEVNDYENYIKKNLLATLKVSGRQAPKEIAKVFIELLENISSHFSHLLMFQRQIK